MKINAFIQIFMILLYLLFPLTHSNAETNEAFKLYQQILSGQKKIENLTPDQQRQVISVHKLLNRSSCDGCSEECRNAKEQAESYRNDLEDYVKRLYRCVEGNDLTDDSGL